jgi:hypothetical protein
MDHEAALRTAFLGFAPSARERFDVRRTAAAMEYIFMGFMQRRKPAPARPGKTELPHAT